MFLFRRSHSDLNILSDLFRIVNTFFYFFSSFFDIDFFAEKKRRKRDLNPRAGHPTYTLSRGASSAT